MDVEQNSPLQGEESPIPAPSSTDTNEELSSSVQDEKTTVPAPSSTDEESPVPAPSSTDVELSSPVQDEEPPIPAPSTTLTGYSLRFAGGPSISQLVAIAVATALYTALSWFCSTFLTGSVPIVSTVFFAIGFGIPFAIWFGGWAFVIAYIGNAVGAGLLAGLPLPVALWFGTVDLIQLGLAMLLYRLLARRLGVDPIGKDVLTVRGFIFFLLCAVLPGNIIGGAYGNAILVWVGFNPASAYYFNWFLWSASNIVLAIVIGSILLRTLGPVVERSGLTVRNALN